VKERLVGIKYVWKGAIVDNTRGFAKLNQEMRFLLKSFDVLIVRGDEECDDRKMSLFTHSHAHWIFECSLFFLQNTYNIVTYWEFYSRWMLFPFKSSTLQLIAISYSPSTAKQCFSVHLLCSSYKRVYTQQCPTQDYTSSNDRLFLTISNIKLK
jgi:hypothetical protein